MKEFIKAFVAAQKEMKSALKESDNPFFKSKYADLASIDSACRFALNTNNIAISQQIDFEGDVDFVRTELLHVSGEKLTSRCRIINLKKDSQGLGSSISYMRRYSLAAICGVVTEDDDGYAADDKQVPKGNTFITNSTVDSKEKCTEPQAKMIYAKLTAKGYVGPEVAAWILKTFNYVDNRDVPYNRVNDVVAAIDKLSIKKQAKHKDYDEPPPFEPNMGWNQ